MKWVVGRVALGLDESLSLRRAWIEMELMARDPAQARVALLTESVD